MVHHISNTLPTRLNTNHHPLNHLPFIPVQKHINPCQGIIPSFPQHITSNNNSVFGGCSMSGLRSVCRQTNKRSYELEDLIHLPGPLTEDAVMRTLQARFNENCYFVGFPKIFRFATGTRRRQRTFGIEKSNFYYANNVFFYNFRQMLVQFCFQLIHT